MGLRRLAGTAILFAKTELHMQPAALGLISVIGTLSGVVGAFAWGVSLAAFQSSCTVSDYCQCAFA